MSTTTNATTWLRLKNELADYFFYRAGTERGFLRLVGWIRFVVLLGLTVRYGLNQQTQDDLQILVGIVPLVLWLYFFYIVILQYLAEYHPALFDSKLSRIIQVVADIAIISFLYAAANDPDSDIFFFYLLPLLVVARYFSGRAILAFTSITMLITIVTWSLLFDRGADFPLPEFWFLKLLSRLGFLAILTIFYIVYQRRRSLLGHLNRAEDELLHQFQRLSAGTFTVDHNLRLTSMSQVMQEQHGPGLIGSGCQNVLCRSTSYSDQPCANCPLHEAIANRKEVSAVGLRCVDRNGNQYRAAVSAHPILNEHGLVIGATGTVYDWAQREIFVDQLRSYGEDVERAVDTFSQEERQRQGEKTRHLEAISRAAAAILSPDQPRAIDEIVRAMASLLRCQWANMRRHHTEKERGEGLYLEYDHGYLGQDVSSWHFLAMDAQSVVMDVFNSGKAQQVENVQRESARTHFRSWAKKHGMYSLASFPLMVQDKTLGVVTLYRNRRELFTPEEMALGQALANNLAAAILNQNLLNRLSHEAITRQKGLDALNTLSHQLVPHHDINSLAQLVTTITCEELNAEISSLFLLQGNTLYREAIAGAPTDWFVAEQYEAGQGITGRTVIKQADGYGGHVICENAVDQSTEVLPEHFARYSQVLESGKPCHLLAVPLNGHNGTFGILRVVNKLDDTEQLHSVGFTDEDVQLMNTIACIVAVALENTRRLAEQTFLMEVGQTITSSLSPEQILATSLDKAVIQLEAEAGAVIMPDPDSGDMVFRFIGGEGAEKLKGRTIPHGQGITGHVYESNQPSLVPDINLDPRFYREVDAQANFTTRSLVSVPIKAGSQTVGVLEILNKRRGRFTVIDLNLLTALSNWIAIAIANARLFAQKRNLDESLIEIMSAGSRLDMLDKIARCVRDLIHCDMTGVALYDPETEEIYGLPDAGYTGVPSAYMNGFRFHISRPGGIVLRSPRIYMTPDVEADPDSLFGQRLTHPLKSRGVMAAPLLVGQRRVGILYAGSRVRREFSEDDQTLFSILAKQAAVAIRNGELLQETKRRAELQELFHQMSVAGQRTSSLDEILNIVLTGITAEYGLRFNRAMLLLSDSSQEKLVGYTGIGQMEKAEAEAVWENIGQQSFNDYVQQVLKNGLLPPTPIHDVARKIQIPIEPDSQEIFSQVFLTGKGMIVDPTDGQWFIDDAFYRLFDPGPFALVPLATEKKVIGMLVVDKKFISTPITVQDRELLEACASQAAAAIERSRLHSRIQKQVEALFHLQKTGQFISQLSDLRHVLKRIVEAANQVLQADVSYLTPYDHKKKESLIDLGVSAGKQYQSEQEHESKHSQTGLTELVLNDPGGLVIIEKLADRPDLVSRFAQREEARSVAVVRLEIHDKVVGILYVNYRQHHRFDELEKSVLRMFADQAAIAIHNAQLMQQVEKRERNRLREDIHDALNTFQFKVKLPLEVIRDRFKKEGDLEVAEELNALWHFCDHVDRTFYRILQDMREPVLLEEGLAAAITRLKTLEDGAQLNIQLTIEGNSRPSADVEHALYRIAQEAVRNIVKHAYPGKVTEKYAEITLALEPKSTSLAVRDNGVGFDTQLVSRRTDCIGIEAMERWAQNAGTELTIKSELDNGTAVEVLVTTQEDTNDTV